MAKCATCGSEFKANRPFQIYCEVTCRPSYNPKKKFISYDLICVVCGKDFKSKNKASRFCSNYCSWAYKQKKKMPEFADLEFCPMLKKCNRLSGIDCSIREDWRACDFLRRIIFDRKNQKGLTHVH